MNINRVSKYLGKKNYADAIVIGGGIVGLSVAYHLAERKVRTFLIDKDYLVNSTSAGSVGALNLQSKRPNSYLSLSIKGAKYYEEFISKLDADIEYRTGGGVTILETEEDFQNKMDLLQEQKGIKGYDLFIFRGEEAINIENNLSHHIKGLSLCPQEGTLNPLLTCWAVQKAAKKLGVNFILNSEVLNIDRKVEGIFSIFTKRKKYFTPILINCAGVGARDIGKMLNIDIPVQPVRGQVLVTEPIPEILHHYVATLNNTKNGNLMIGTTKEMDIDNSDVRIDSLINMAKRASRLLPCLKQVSVIRTWARSRPIPIDGLPIFGSVPAVPGFYNVVTHSGFVLGPLFGKLITELITESRTSIPMDLYSIERFSSNR